MAEAGLFVLGEPYDRIQALYALRIFQNWYRSDRLYGDRAMIQCDYYNSLVIQPMDPELVWLFSGEMGKIEKMRSEVTARAPTMPPYWNA